METRRRIEAMTPAQRRVWEAVSRGRCAGLRFARRARLGGYRADFYCPAASLALEVGAVAREPERTDALATIRGLWTLRLRDEFVLRATADQIRETVLRAIVERPLELPACVIDGAAKAAR